MKIGTLWFDTLYMDFRNLTVNTTFLCNLKMLSYYDEMLKCEQIQYFKILKNHKVEINYVMSIFYV